MHFKKMGKRRRLVFRLIVVNVVLLGLALVWHWQSPDSVAVAAAKTKNMMAMGLMPSVAVDETAVKEIVLADTAVAALLNQQNYDFVSAIPLTEGESRSWQDMGCGWQQCVHAVIFNHDKRETVNAIVLPQTKQVLATWTEANARPQGSMQIVDEAMAVAAADAQVTAVLGNIGDADPAMIPMSAWLKDDDCAQDWCVDLTFHDPNGTGKIFHVFVNMRTDTVARTFYTRAREDLPVAKPFSQRAAYSDGCHEQYGWNVCWEMTAHDGILFKDATYNEQPIFSSIKIGQIEAWYPSWPGGYRDEIGFSASVPPFGGTEVNDLGDSFEVRQLFTEFTHWPNCICCYRYEEVVRFYDDGTFEPRFVSHGPGCDDLSQYRPFWRIDLNLGDAMNDEAWVWQGGQWVEMKNETELHPFVDDVSPFGEKVATLDEALSLNYRWSMLRTDPLGLDEAYFFVVRKNDLEGDGPIVTGPGDTFQPPRQYVNNEAIFGEDLVLWFVPILKTKKSNPLWCMPDPEPGINQCEAILRAEPGPDLSVVEPTAVPTATPNTPPTPTPTPAPTATPRPIEGDTPEDVILNAGCGACHEIGALGEAGKVGPDLSNIGNLANGRVAGMPAEEYIRLAITEPNLHIAPACPNGPCLPNIMPQDYTARLSPAQIDTMVTFLLAQKDDTSQETPEPAIIGTDTAVSAPKAFPAPKTTPARPQLKTSTLVVEVLLFTLVFLLGIFRIIKEEKSS